MATPSIDQVASVLTDIGSSLLHQPWLHEDGGFGRDPQAPSDEWSTAETLLLIGRLELANSATVVANARTFLLSRQHENGGWGSNSVESETVSTAMVLLALLDGSQRGDVKTAAEAGMSWLAKYQNSDGGWSIIPTDDRQKISTIYATIHVYEAVTGWFSRGVGPSGQTNEVITLASHYLALARTRDGLWGVAEDSPPSVLPTSYAVIANLSDQVRGSPHAVAMSHAQRKNIKIFLQNSQHDDGSWGEGVDGDVESTAVVVRALILLGRAPTTKEVRAAVAYLLRTKKRVRDDDDASFVGWRASNRGEITIWCVFYTGLALLEYKRVLENQRAQDLLIRLPQWRKYASVLAFLVFIAIVISVSAGAVFNGVVGTALAAIAALAGIISVLPVIKDLYTRSRLTRGR
jgi:prenyltransferase beta subunit